MEAKKAQQSLESTYKQLDSVSLKEASIILDVSLFIFYRAMQSCWIYSSLYMSFCVGVTTKEGEKFLRKQPAAC